MGDCNVKTHLGKEDTCTFTYKRLVELFRKRHKDGQAFPLDKTVHGGSASNIESRLSESSDRGNELNDYVDSDNEGMSWWHNGKLYKVSLDEGLGIIAVDERFQDENNEWHTGKNIFFAQGKDGQTVAKDAGGFYIDKIMEYLDGAGALLENKPKWKTKSALYNSLLDLERERILTDVGIPKENFEPYTIDDIKYYANIPYDNLSDELQNRINQRLDKIDYANMLNNAYTH